MHVAECHTSKWLWNTAAFAWELMGNRHMEINNNNNNKPKNIPKRRTYYSIQYFIIPYFTPSTVASVRCCGCQFSFVLARERTYITHRININ